MLELLSHLIFDKNRDTFRLSKCFQKEREEKTKKKGRKKSKNGAALNS